MAATAKIPPPPRTLDAAGKALWRGVLQDYELGAGELELLAAACAAHSQRVQAQAILDRDGIIAEGLHGPRAHPAVAIARDNAALLARLLRQLRVELEEDRVQVKRTPGAGRPATVRARR